jgi:hypothetical protein
MVKQIAKILLVVVCGVGGYILTDVAWNIPNLPIWLKEVLYDTGLFLFVGAIAFCVVDLIKRLLGKSTNF